MLQQPTISVLAVSDANDRRLETLLRFLEGSASVVVQRLSSVPGDLSLFDAVMTVDMDAGDPAASRLLSYAESGGGWLSWITNDRVIIPDAFGVALSSVKPPCELRVLFKDREHWMGHRLPDAIYVDGPLIPLEITRPETEIILYADWHYAHQWVMAGRKKGEGRLACTTIADLSHPVVRQLVLRQLRQLAGLPIHPRPMGVGILGYAPSVGKLHGTGADQTQGLILRAACDLDAGRRTQASADFPGITLHGTPESMAADPQVDLVIVATPPNTHARLSIRMMEAGKHVVCEKPMAISRSESEAMAEAADVHRVHLSCHQNRRWDPDYLAIKKALDDGRIGDLFHMETFVGHYHHPCGYWHSHVSVSGGTRYDWGAHYLDWMVSLIPETVSGVLGTRHKRVWHDVTNADQERITIRFAGGQEAEFLHSDIAAARKPKWYLLGTKGAIVGRWKDVPVYQLHPDHYYDRNDIPATEMPPELTAYGRERSGNITSRRLDLLPRDPTAFHKNLADHLLTGEAIAAPLSDSLKVVAILEAAGRSMENGGRLEAPHGP